MKRVKIGPTAPYIHLY